MNKVKERLVVVGGSAGGPSAAAKASRVNPDLEIIMYEQGPFVSYGAWETPYYIGDVVKEQRKLIARTPEQFKAQNVDVRLFHKVTQIDPENKKIEVFNIKESKSEWIHYDKLVVATGARSRKFNIPGNDAKNIFSLKDLKDGITIKDYIDKTNPKKGVIIGAGLIGLEMSEAFRDRGIETYLISLYNLPVASILEPEIAQKVLNEIEEKGVKFIPNAKTEAFKVSQDGLALGVETNQGEFDADIVLTSIGVIPNVELAKNAGIKLGDTGAIHTDMAQRTNIDDIFAAGDCCEVFNLVSQSYVFTPLGDIANKQGRTAGENAAGGHALFYGVVGSSAFKVFDLEVAFTGLNERMAKAAGFDVGTHFIRAESKVGYMPGSQRMMIKYIFDKKSSRLLGAQMVGKEGVARRINTLAAALHFKATLDDISRFDLAYAPPFSAPYDPVLIAAEQSMKKMG